MAADPQHHSGLARIRTGLNMPLTEAIRPQNFTEYIGQDHLLNTENGAIANYLRLGYLPSMVLSGPPGVGKTSLARLLAAEANYVFVELSATASTVADLKELSGSIDAENHKRLRYNSPRLRVLVFIDEIHRFSVVQQDYLLPFIERGSFVFVGATTADPEKRVRRAILSRCHVFKLTGLANRHLDQVARRAVLFDNIRQKLRRKRRFLTYTDAAIAAVVKYASGDMRSAVNLIEILGSRYIPGATVVTTEDTIGEATEATEATETKETKETQETKETKEETTIDENVVTSFINTLNKTRFGLNSDANLPLLAHLLKCLRHPQKRHLADAIDTKFDANHASTADANSTKTRQTPEDDSDATSQNDSDLESWADENDPAPFEGTDPKLKEWADHIVFSDDDDILEPGSLYSDDDEQPQRLVKSPSLSRFSASKFRIVAATHACLQLLNKGESVLCILKYLILFTCTHARPEKNDLIKVLSVLKAVEKSGIGGEQLLFNCIERLAGMQNYEQKSLRESVETARRYCGETTKKPPQEDKEVSLECEVVYDNDLAEKLLQDILEQPEQTCLGMPVVDIGELGSDYILGEGLDLMQPQDKLRGKLQESLHN